MQLFKPPTTPLNTPFARFDWPDPIKVFEPEANDPVPPTTTEYEPEAILPVPPPVNDPVAEVQVILP